MKMRVPTTGHRPRSRVRAWTMLALCFAALVGLFTALPASAQLQLPPIPPLPLPTVAPGVQTPVSQTITGVSKLLDGVPEQLGGVGSQNPPAPLPRPALRPKGAQVDSWSIDRLPALRGTSARTAISSTRLEAPGSYSSLVSGGFKAAAGRAANLAGPLAAPLAVALFAIGLLALAARAPSRLVKVDDERQAFGERRSYRL
jgi:hypothetical protein